MLLARKMTSRHRSTSNYNVVVCYRPTTMETIYGDEDMSGIKLILKMDHNTLYENYDIAIAMSSSCADPVLGCCPG